MVRGRVISHIKGILFAWGTLILLMAAACAVIGTGIGILFALVWLSTIMSTWAFTTLSMGVFTLGIATCVHFSDYSSPRGEYDVPVPPQPSGPEQLKLDV